MAEASVFDRFPMPPIASLLGWRLLEADPATGRVRIAFEGKPEFRNPAGFIQGGILASMLDDTMGPAVLVASDGAYFTTTIDMNVSFLAPAKVGEILGEGWWCRWERPSRSSNGGCWTQRVVCWLKPPPAHG